MGSSIGVDSHKCSLAAAAVDELGRVIGVREFPNDPQGHLALLAWARDHETPRAIGVKGSGNYGAALCRALSSAGERVLEVPATLTFRERRRKGSQGKSDQVDAVAIARVVARGEVLPSPRRARALADLKLLSDYRDQLLCARTQLANRVHRDLVILRPGYQQVVPNLVGAKHLSRAASLVKADPSVRAELVRRRIAELRRVSNEIAETKARLRKALAESGTTLTEVPGIGPLIAAKILGEVGDVDRIRSQAAFAMMAGTAPLIASSGMSSRHRLNRGGNRKLNFALHYMALVRYRSDEDTRRYIERRRAEGKTFKEAMRCLKRHLCNVVYRQMISDWRAMQSV
jgi:transposase